MESRVKGNLHARFGGGRETIRKYRLPYKLLVVGSNPARGAGREIARTVFLDRLLTGFEEVVTKGGQWSGSLLVLAAFGPSMDWNRTIYR